MINGKIEISDALLSLVPRDETYGNAQFTYKNNDLDQLYWMDERPRPTNEEIQNEMDRLQADYDAKEYQRKREVEYPSIKDQLDKIYHEGIDKWKDEMIKPVKDKYPKESS